MAFETAFAEMQATWRKVARSVNRHYRRSRRDGHRPRRRHRAQEAPAEHRVLEGHDRAREPAQLDFSYMQYP